MTTPETSRWERPTDFPFNGEFCNTSDISSSIAACLIFNAAGTHDFIMNSERSKWIKIPSMILLDAVLLATAPIIAVAEAALRAAIAVIISPMFFAKCCSEAEWTEIPKAVVLTAVYSLMQIPNTFYTIYQTFTSPGVFNPPQDAHDMMNAIFVDIDESQMKNSLTSAATLVFANTIDAIKRLNPNGWVKAFSFLLLDVTLCLTVPIFAVAETAVRLALAIITSPLFLFTYCSKAEILNTPCFMLASAVYSLVQLPNAFYTAYLSFASSADIDAKRNTSTIANMMFCS